jgi:tetratricopeptide (TPR) repeat protein
LHYKRGLAQMRQQRMAEAAADFDEALRLEPRLTAVYLDRALARVGQGRHADALADLTFALEHGAPAARVLLMRAQVRHLAGDDAGAAEDRRAGLRLEPVDVPGWLARGSALLNDNVPGALAAFDRALELDAASLPALQSKAYLLAEKQAKPLEAIAVLDRVVTLYPDYAPGWAGRGVLLARQGKRADALRDATAALGCSSAPAVLYQVAGIYALTSQTHPDDQDEALRLLASALRQGYGRDRLATDEDLAPLRTLPRFRQMLADVPAPGKGPQPER